MIEMECGFVKCNICGKQLSIEFDIVETCILCGEHICEKCITDGECFNCMENSLVESKNNLPANIEDLAKFVLVGKEKLISVKAEIRAMKNLKIAEDVYKQKEIEAKQLGGTLLLAKVRIGELLKDIPKAKNQYDAKHHKEQTKTNKLEEMGITKKVKENCEKLADNKDIVEDVINNSEDIPTQTECLKKIKNKKKAEKKKEREKSLKETAKLPESKFQVLYCDPPWQYNNSGLNGSADSKYNTMSIEELCNMPIKENTEENAVCFMWCTNPLLEDGLKLLKAWGFEYKTNMVWIKEKSNYGKLGFYVFGQHELLLIGIKGSMLPIGEKPKSVIQGENKIHSKKPEIVYEIIESMYPDLKYLELFARNEKRKNWVKWGNEVGKYEK
jgi:N6-adenosine-specific RNA methylase IME4